MKTTIFRAFVFMGALGVGSGLAEGITRSKGGPREGAGLTATAVAPAQPAKHSAGKKAAGEVATGAMRIDYKKVAPGVFEAMQGLEKYVRGCGLEKPLLNLVKIRASQINGCAYCLALHTKDARASGEAEQKLLSLEDWRNAACYTPRERAALAWTESLTLVSEKRVPTALFNEARKQFSERELVDLSMAIIAINGWNRLNISFRSEPESCPIE